LQIRPALVAAIVSLDSSELTPLRFQKFECDLLRLLREFGRSILSVVVNGLEENGASQLPLLLRHNGLIFRKMRKKTPNRIATLFGMIELVRIRYRLCDRGVREPCLFPLERALGLQCGVTPALASRIGSLIAAAGATQNRVLQDLKVEHNVHIGMPKLRKLMQVLSEGLGECSRDTRVRRLLDALTEAFGSTGDAVPVLAVGRDGITLREYWHRLFEVATAATVSVYDRSGKRLVTIYLACVPELGQATMSRELTSLLQQVLREWNGELPTLAYVSDSGDNESNYFEQVLRKMSHPRTTEPLDWQRVVDYYHVAERIWTIATALFGKESKKGTAWARRMLKNLKRPRGAKRVLHSAAFYAKRRCLSKSAAREFKTACAYIRNRTRWMRYDECKRRHIPLGSGVTEAACKTVFTMRLKQSGMRWTKEGAARVLTLRTILLSGVWTATYDAYLKGLAKQLPAPYFANPPNSRRIAA
jgi:hypothetical protein